MSGRKRLKVKKFLCNRGVMFDIEFLSCVEVTISVDKVLSENFSYKPVNRGRYVSLILSNEARDYKETIKTQCEDSDFHDYVKCLNEGCPNIVIKSSYEFLIPFKSFFTQEGDLTRCDVTNMVKSVEDSILGEVIDDKYVIENTVRKSPVMGDYYYIVASYMFYKFFPSKNLNLENF